MYVASLVVSVAVDLVVVHDTPPSHDNCTQIFGELLVLSALGVQAHFDALNQRRDRNAEAVVVEAVFVLLRAECRTSGARCRCCYRPQRGRHLSARWLC